MKWNLFIYKLRRRAAGLDFEYLLMRYGQAFGELLLNSDRSSTAHQGHAAIISRDDGDQSPA